MATNENVNKVIYGNQTIMDITDTTAEESDVASGEVFYKANGERSVGTLNKDSAVWGNISGTLSDQTDLQNALDAKQNTLTLPLSTANGGTGNADGYIRTGLRTGTTIGNYSTIEGGNNRSPGNYAHSEGSFCGAEGSCSHAEGSYTTASGIHSHSEGAYTSARGENSHAEGQNTIAEYKNQHVQGVYNDNKSTTLFEVGNGASSSNRSNAFEVYNDGHINVNGDIYQNGKLYNDKATQGLLKSTVGWIGKNKLPNTAKTKTINGVTFTVNEDGRVTANGTATANANFNLITNGTMIADGLLLSGCNGGSMSTYYIRAQIGSDFKSVYDGESVPLSNGTLTALWIGVVNGQTVNNVTFYPMLRDASITDDAYEPYHESVEEIIENISPALITSPMPSYVANSLPVRKKDITNDFYNGSLRAEIAAGNFKNVRPGDYIIGQSSGSTYYVACLDYRLGKGDKTNNANYPAYGTHHLGLMLFKHNGATRLWAGYGSQDKSWRGSANEKGRCPWNAAADVDPTDSEAIGTNNTNITRQYNGANVSGYMGSFIRERIDAIILTEDFIADFGSANVLKYREMNGNAVATDKPSGGQGNWNGCTSGWSWYDRFLDLPSEIELYGSRVFSSAYDIGCRCEQLPLFRNAAIHDFFPRLDIWTKAVASGSSAAGCSHDGSASSGTASYALWTCPLACVK
jgi:hypothetical protein